MSQATTADTAERIQTYAEFWPFYLREHSDPTNRWFHFAGTTAVLLLGATALATANPWLVPLIPVAGYGPAWIGHFFIEKNRPASFKYPLWSLISDFRMYAWMWRGRI
jgi:hypothetical protein